MCGRYVLTSPPQTVAALFEIPGDIPNYPPRYNIAPTQPVAVVHRNAEGKGAFMFSLMRWGLVPHWSRGPDSRYSMINARAETLAAKPAYRGAFRYRRCLLPTNGFYEWKAMSKGPKQPYLIGFEGGALFFLAGLWEHWLGGDGNELQSVTITTTAAAGIVGDIHDRMPVILDAHDGRRWIDGTGLEQITQSHAIDGLDATPVSRHVNDVSFDDPSCINPVSG